MDAIWPCVSCLEKQVTQLTNEVREVVAELRPLVQKLLQIEVNQSTWPDIKNESTQTNSYPSFQLINDSLKGAPRPKENLRSQMTLQPAFTHDYSSCNLYSKYGEIKVEGHEETCAYINDIRKRFTDADRANELPYIQNPSQEVERVLLANYTALTSKPNKTTNDELILNRFNVLRFPTLKEKDPDSFYYWLKKLVWYKHTYFIPDYLIRDGLLNVTHSLNEPGLTSVVRSSCKTIKGSLSLPIRYDLIFRTLEDYIIDDEKQDIINIVNDVIHLGLNPKSIMITIRAEIDTFIRVKYSKELSPTTWIQIFKMLFEDLEEIMDRIIDYIQPIVRVTRPDQKGVSTIVELDGSEIKAHLKSIKKDSQEQVLAMQMTVNHVEIWEAISVTHALRAPLIHLVNKPKKSALPKTNPCLACGRSGHKLVKCYDVRRAVKDGLVSIQNGLVYSFSGEQLKVNKSEVMVKKYAKLFLRRT